MYNRDSFWSLMGVYDKEASEEIFNAWASTQDERGAIGTIITPSMGSREVKGNEATLEFYGMLGLITSFMELLYQWIK